jgi:TRAP-type mannitol/chloroaromatic compound transport system substrate-binding protein
MFKKVLDSQRAFAERAVRWQNDVSVNTRMAFSYLTDKT